MGVWSVAGRPWNEWIITLLRLIEPGDLHDGHEEHRHVEHRGDAQGDLLPRLGWNEENKPEMGNVSIYGC